MDIIVKVMMIDRTRGDLFACFSEDADYIVQVDHGVPRSERASQNFVIGSLKLDEEGRPVALMVDRSGTFVSCHRLTFALLCDNCGAPTRQVGERHVCILCGALLAV